MARNGGCNSGCNGERYGELYGERDSGGITIAKCETVVGQQVSGHLTVTLACSLLAEAAQATTPPIPLLVAPAQGLGTRLGPTLQVLCSTAPFFFCLSSLTD